MKRFDLNSFRQSFTLPSDFVAPLDAPIRLFVDGAFTSSDTSDPSCIAVGYRWTREDGEIETYILDCVNGRFRGIALPTKIVDLAEAHRPQRIVVEKIPGGVDLLVDVIKLIATTRNVATGYIEVRNANNVKNAKALRFARLNDAAQRGLLKIRRGSFIDQLMDELEQFDFSCPGNHRRCDDTIDSICGLCF